MMPRLSRRGALALGLGAAASAGAGLALARSAPGPAAHGGATVTVRARAFSRLYATGEADPPLGNGITFLGGLDLTCDDPLFGGLSGLSITDEGRLLAVTDRGTWLAATLDTAGGRPTGLSHARLAPMLGPKGETLSRTRRFDSESLCVVAGVAYVGFERVHEVLRFAVGRDGLSAKGQPLPMPPETKSLPSNQSLESVAVVPRGPHAGQVIAIAERSAPGDDSPTQGFFITGQRGGFTVVRRDGFDITDAAFLPSGDLLLLERRFRWTSGVAMRLRRVAGSMLRPGAVLDGPTLISLTGEAHIDNMEGLAVQQTPQGIVVTMVSDDNFSVLQKTVLLQFLLGDTPQRVAA